LIRGAKAICRIAATETYSVRTFKGNTFEVQIIERDGELGVGFNTTGYFLNIKEFVNVEVLNYDSK
jgi:hypothetical protein